MLLFFFWWKGLYDFKTFFASISFFLGKELLDGDASSIVLQKVTPVVIQYIPNEKQRLKVILGMRRKDIESSCKPHFSDFKILENLVLYSIHKLSVLICQIK